MFASLIKTTGVAALAVGLALAGAIVTPADAAVRHSTGGVHSTSIHSAGIQRGSIHGGNRGYAGRNYRGHGAGYGGYGYGYGDGFAYSCPSFPHRASCQPVLLI
jgi:hypothetical protein